MRSSSVWTGRLVALVCAVIGVLLVGQSALAPQSIDTVNSAFTGVLGLVMVAVAVAVWAIRGSGADPGRRTALGTLDDRPALVVRLRPTTPLVMVVIGVAFAGLFLVAVFAVGPGDGGLLFAPLVLMFAALVPDGVQALVRGPRLALGIDHVELRGWTLDARLAWEDVASVQVEAIDPRRARLLISGRPGAASWQQLNHRIIVPLDRRPAVPEIAVLVTALDAPNRVEVLSRRFAESRRDARSTYLDEGGVAFLSDGR